MRTAQPGDRVQVRYVKRFQDGAVHSSRRSAPLEVTVGEDHPRLPGLGSALVGLTPGKTAVVRVAPDQAYGPVDPTRIRRLDRARFPEDKPLAIGKWVELHDRRGRRRVVRILEDHGKTVVVDTNHRYAGQTLELEVELIGIAAAASEVEPQGT